jgi:predicted acetyltransferase
MAVEYRPVRPEEMRRFIYNSKIGFGETTAEADVDRLLALTLLRPEWTLCAFEDGEIASQMGTFPFIMRWNGGDVGCGAVTAVSTLPSHRRRGYLRELMTRAFADMRAGGQPVAMLWASMAAIYQRFGYGVGYTQFISDFDPRHLRFVDEILVPGRTRLVKSTEAPPVIAPVYARFAAPRTLMLRREDEWWDRSVFRPWRPDMAPFLVAVYEEAGETLGYVVYAVAPGREDQPGPTQRIDVLDFVWLTPAAHRALIAYLAGHDLVGHIRFWRLPADDPLFFHAQEPRLLGFSVSDGTLVRIVDVQAALEARGYDADGRLRFAMTDDLCPWNSGTWELTVEGGTGRLKESRAESEITLTPRALAILASGHQPATMLARIGLIPSTDTRALRTADALFRTTHAPLCTDGF